MTPTSLVKACDNFIYIDKLVPLPISYEKEIERNRIKKEKREKIDRIIKNKQDTKIKRTKEIVREAQIEHSRLRPLMNDTSRMIVQNVIIPNSEKKLFIGNLI
jgi:hypothetical protein